MITLGRSWRAKNSPKLSSKYLKERIRKIKQYLNYILMIINQNLAVLRTFLNLQKKLWKNVHQQKPEAATLLKKRLWDRCFICEIGKIFKNTFFIQHLRTTASDTKQFSTVATTKFLSKILNRKKISNEHFNHCEAEISLDEIIKFLNSETNDKYPGNDDLAAEFYEHFLNELAPFVLDLYDSWGKLGTMGVTSRTGIISVTYKKIDKKDIANYRSIYYNS